MKKFQDLLPGDTVTALTDGIIAVCGATYEVYEIQITGSACFGLTLLKPNSSIPKEEWSTFDVFGSDIGLSNLFRIDMDTKEIEQHPDIVVTVGGVRDFIYRITQDDANSPISKSEIEDIARCAINGGYRLDVDSFTAAYGRFKLGMDIDN